jgi:hypothetical protein
LRSSRRKVFVSCFQHFSRCQETGSRQAFAREFLRDWMTRSA